MGRITEADAADSFRRLLEAATARRLTLLSVRWHGMQKPYLFRCAQGHEFTRFAVVVTKGAATCPQCKWDNQQRRFLDTLEKRGFTCEDNRYPGMYVRTRFTCRHGHTWETMVRKVMGGSGCHVCARKEMGARNSLPDGLSRLHTVAAARGGRLLDEVYRGTGAVYEWECAAGHRWKIKASRIIEGHWCKPCSFQNRRLRIERMQDIARARGGQCLSDSYQGSGTRLMWQCHLGHVWNARPAKVIYSGTWCPNCAVLNRTKNPVKRKRYDIYGG